MRTADMQVYMDGLGVMRGEAPIDLSKLDAILTDEFGHRYAIRRLPDEHESPPYLVVPPGKRRWWWPW